MFANSGRADGDVHHLEAVASVVFEGRARMISQLASYILGTRFHPPWRDTGRVIFTTRLTETAPPPPENRGFTGD